MYPKTAPGGKEDKGETLVRRVHRLGLSDNTVTAVDNTTSSDGPAAPEPIALAEAGTSGPEETLGQRRAELQAQTTLKGGLRPTSESSANLLASASNKMGEAQGKATLTGKDVVESAGKLYAIRSIAGKGKGLVATTRIEKGTRLLSEVPIFRVPRDNNDIKDLERIVADEVKCLGDDQQRAFFDLTNIYGNAHSEAFGIARTNVLPLGSSARSGGLFLEASRINHSCKHNSQNTWNENIGQLTIHSLRDIEAGQEITISYLVRTSEYAERQRFLKEKFKFECKCELCSLPRAQRKHSDTRLKNLQAIDKSIEAFFWGELEPEKALRLIHTMFGLFDEEGIWNANIARAYEDAYEIATDNEDESRARVFTRRAYDALRLIEGDDSSRTLKMKKASEELSAAQIPQGMNEAEFENWLWMLT